MLAGCAWADEETENRPHRLRRSLELRRVAAAGDDLQARPGQRLRYRRRAGHAGQRVLCAGDDQDRGVYPRHQRPRVLPAVARDVAQHRFSPDRPAVQLLDDGRHQALESASTEGREREADVDLMVGDVRGQQRLPVIEDGGDQGVDRQDR